METSIVRYTGYTKIMIEFRYTGDELYARMDRAVEKVTQRPRKTVRIIEDARIHIYWI